MSSKNNGEISAHAYSPGLEIKIYKNVVKNRRLPIKGEVVVNIDDIVNFDSVVAETKIPGNPYVVPVANELRVSGEDCDEFFSIDFGSSVKKGQCIARRTSFFGLIKYECLSPVDGILESYTKFSGKAIIREKSKNLQINAYIPGKITEVIENEGVIIETKATFIQGIFGIGGERHGELVTPVKSRDEILTPEKLNLDYKGKIIAGYSFITTEALKKAQEIGVKGIIVGGIDLFELNEFMGYTIGVAITGLEDINFSLIVTEGFGKMTISQKVFNLLQKFNGYEIAINGTTQIRAGVIRPEIIIPYKEDMGITDLTSEDLSMGMRPGTRVKIIREPFFGEIAVIKELIVKSQVVETESTVRVIRVMLEDCRKVLVPRANVEIIQE